MRASEPKLKWYQFRLASLFVLFALVAFILGILVSPLPKRVAEEFDRVPDGFVTFSWMAMPKANTADKAAWVVKTHWYAERPFDLQIYRQPTLLIPNGDNSRQDVGLSMRSRPQLVGHNAVLDCEFSFSGNCLTVVDTTDGGRSVVGESTVSDTRNIRWMGIPVADLPHSRWRRAVFIGRYGGLQIVACGVGTKPADDSVEDFYCEFTFVGTEN